MPRAEFGELYLLGEILKELNRNNAHLIAINKKLGHIYDEQQAQTKLLEELVEDEEGPTAQSATLVITKN